MHHSPAPLHMPEERHAQTYACMRPFEETRDVGDDQRCGRRGGAGGVSGRGRLRLVVSKEVAHAQVGHDRGKGIVRDLRLSVAELKRCIDEFVLRGVLYKQTRVSHLEAAKRVDLPALGIPTRPTSAISLSSMCNQRSSPGSPFSAKTGAFMRAVLKCSFPRPPLPPLATSNVCPSVFSSPASTPSASLTIVPGRLNINSAVSTR